MASLSSSPSSSSSSSTKNMEKKKQVSLKTYEGEIFQVDEHVALQSETIKRFKTMMNEGNGDTEFPVANVMSKTLERVIKYCEKHQHVVDDASSSSVDDADAAAAAAAAAEELSAWDSEFVKSFNRNELYHLLLASNYLEVKGLMDLIIQWVANMIKGKSPEEIRKTLGIKNDFAPGQEEEIRRENPWAFEIPAAAEIHQQPPPPSEEHNDQDTTKVLEEKLEKLEIDDQQDKPVVDQE